MHGQQNIKFYFFKKHFQWSVFVSIAGTRIRLHDVLRVIFRKYVGM